MKNSILTGFIILISLLCSAQTTIIPPDLFGEPPSAQINFYPNNGQLIDITGGSMDEILYYSKGSSPAVYVADYGLSFVYSQIDTSASTNDYLHRIDIAPPFSEDPETPNIYATEASNINYLNYFLPHCGSGITGVEGNKRVIYEDFNPGIDLHTFSNANGLKFYFVVDTDVDPNSLELILRGQDSLLIEDDEIAIYIAQEEFRLDEVHAFQIGPNETIIPLSAPAIYKENSNGHVTIEGSGYNSSYPTVFQIGGPAYSFSTPTNENLCWSTYYGGTDQEFTDALEPHDGDPLFIGYSLSNNFPLSFGTTPLQSMPIGGADAFLVRFNQDAEPIWTTYYGGSSADYGIDAVINSEDEVILGINTRSSDLFTSPSTPTYGGVAEGYWVKISINPLSNFQQIEFARYLGGSGHDFIRDIDISSNDHFFIVGSTTQPTFPKVVQSGAYNQNHADPGTSDAFIAEFDDNNNLIWSTFFGGNENDILKKIAIKPNGGLLLLGHTESDEFDIQNQTTGTCSAPTNGNFPICNFPGAYNLSSAGGNSDLIIAEFNSQNQLIWSTLFGGNGDEYAFWNTNLEMVPGSSDDFYIAGHTDVGQGGSFSFPLASPSGSFAYSTPYLGTVNLGSGFISQFDSRQLTWSTLYGCPDAGTLIYDLTIDNNGTVYVAGYTECNTVSTTPCSPSSGTTDFPICENTDFFQQVDNTGNSIYAGGDIDGFVASFDGNDHSLLWSTWFGSDGYEHIRDISFDPVTERVYLSGYTAEPVSTQIPLVEYNSTVNTDYYQSIIADPIIPDGFVAALCIGPPATAVDDLITSPLFQIFPNPSKDKINIDFFENTPHSYSLSIYDLQGKRILFEVHSPKIIDVSSFSTGIYMVQITYQEKMYSRKLIIQ